MNTAPNRHHPSCPARATPLEAWCHGGRGFTPLTAGCDVTAIPHPGHVVESCRLGCGSALASAPRTWARRIRDWFDSSLMIAVACLVLLLVASYVGPR